MSHAPEPSGRGSAPARVALAGNPSDGYRGAVLAVAFHERRAQALATPAAVSVAKPASELVTAAAARWQREFPGAQAGYEVRWGTTIPRGVGLGGSSAIVIATLRALGELDAVSLAPNRLAALALAVETEELGIAAGPQDRVAQIYGGLTFMDFARASHRYERLDSGLLAPLVVCWRTDTGADSGPLHADLRERFGQGDPVVRDAIAAAAAAAQEARAALLAGDRPRFRRSVDATFDARRRMLPLDPRHVEMVEVARESGAAANYTGSGGAIVAVCDDPAHQERVAAHLRAVGCAVKLQATQDTPPRRRNPMP
jgi:glucuronokinase